MAEYIDKGKAKELLIGDYAYAATDLLDKVPIEIELPCKVGDTIYQIDNSFDVYSGTVVEIVFVTNHIAFDKRAVGKSIFLTKEEVERALKEREIMKLDKNRKITVEECKRKHPETCKIPKHITDGLFYYDCKKKECPLYEMTFNNQRLDEIEKVRALLSNVCDIAINAMKKQIPNKIEIWNGQCLCPECEKIFGDYLQLKQLIHWEMPYCQYCGQALDWSVEE